MRLFFRMLFLALASAFVYGIPALHAQDEAAIYRPNEGHEVVIYTLKIRPEHYRESLELISGGFISASEAIKQRRHNIILAHPSTHELVNISFFDEGSSVADWHESKERLSVIGKLKPMLAAPIDIQVYEVVEIVNSTQN